MPTKRKPRAEKSSETMSSSSESQAQDPCVVELTGEATVVAAPDALAALRAALQARQPARLDLARASEIDTAVFQLVLSAQRSFARAGLSFSLHDPANLFRSLAARLGVELNGGPA